MSCNDRLRTGKVVNDLASSSCRAIACVVPMDVGSSSTRSMGSEETRSSNALVFRRIGPLPHAVSADVQTTAPLQCSAEIRDEQSGLCQPRVSSTDPTLVSCHMRRSDFAFHSLAYSGFFFFSLLFVSIDAAPSFLIGMGALTSFRQATSRVWRSFALSGIVWLRFFVSPTSSRRL